MPRGVKVADVYAELNLDKDVIRQAVRGLGGELGPDADRAGRELGDRVSRGLAEKVEALSARLTKARLGEQKAADAVTLAEKRLSEAREKGNQKASTLLALEQKLAQAQSALSAAQENTTRSTNRLSEAQRRLATEVDNMGRTAGPNAERAGSDIGGKLSQGIHLSIVRNSPLIAAAIGAGLVAGAPVALAGATALFGGIGIVAAAQSDKVQSAWLGTWHRVRDGAIADAGVIEPVLVRMADRVGDSFDAMRPRLRDAFSASAPQIAVFTEGIIGLAENALPGLVRAVERGMPVTRGFAEFLEKTGTGISGFFDGISAHAPAAGQAMASLGDVLGKLLPLLGDVLGQGAELAAVALPLLSNGLGLVLAIARPLLPILPPLAAGIAALKIAQAAGDWVGGLGGRLTDFSTRGGVAAGAAGKVGGALTAVSAAAGPVGLAIGVVAGAMAHGEQQAQDYARAMMAGGDATDHVMQEAAKGGIIEALTQHLGGLGTVVGLWTTNTDEASEAQRNLWQSMDPVAQAQSKVAYWTAELSQRLNDENATSADVEAAKRRLAYWAEQETQRQGELEMATRGVTQAMVEQANQALASIDSGFAYQNSLDQLEDRQRELNEATRDHGAASEEADDATRSFAEGLFQTAQNMGRHKADLSGLEQGTAEYARVVQTEALAELYRLRDAFPQMAGPINEMIGRIEGAGVSLTELGQYHPTPTLDADPKPLNAKLSDAEARLNIVNTLKGIPLLDLNINPFAGAEASARARIGDLNAQRPTPTAFLNSVPLMGGLGAALSNVGLLGGQRPTPTAGMNTGPFAGSANWMSGTMGWLNNLRANPSAFLTAQTSNAEAWLNYTARNRSSTVFQYVQTVGHVGGRALGGPIERVYAAATGRKVTGPGGPTDDLVKARSSDGSDWRLSPGEWIVNAFVSQRQGDARMAALNAGRATIVPDRPDPGDPGGGAAAGSTAMAAAAGASTGGAAAAGDPSPAAGVTIHGDVVVKVETPLNLMSSADLRKAGLILREVIIGIDREQS